MAENRPLKMFLSYSRKDREYLDELRAHLANLREEGLIEDWHDNEVQAGEEWEKEILSQFEAAEVILLLISADFNNSRFCRKIEMQRAVEREREGTALVVPVIVRQVEALPQEIRHLQCLPDPKKPMASYASRDVGYAEVVAALRKRLQGLRSPSSAAETKHTSSAADRLVLPPDDRSEVLEVRCEFQPHDDGYRLVVHVGFEHPQSVTVPETVRLGESERLPLGDGSQVTLGQLAHAIGDGRWQPASWFDESAQLAIGRKLFDETIGRIDAVARREAVDLRIATEDEHLRRLPWPLLNRRGIFLVHEAWTTSLTLISRAMRAATLPSHPDILMIAPDPYPDRPTEAAAHASDLRTLLRDADYALGAPDKFVEVRTWDELQRATSSRSFDVVYFYGHAIDQSGVPRLVFASTDGGSAELRPVVEFAQLLRRMNPRPALVCVNSLLHDSGHLLGVGNQLGSFLPCVITNRVDTRPAVARKQACALFRQVLLDAMPPEQAVLGLQNDLSREETEGMDPAWYTPVLYANYSRWSHVSPRDHRRPRIQAGWQSLLNRSDQWGKITWRLREMLRNRNERNKRALAIIAYGTPTNGLTHFRERIRCFVHDELEVGGQMYQPAWPPYQPRSDAERRRWFDHLIESCGRPTLRQLAREFRTGVLGSKTLTVFNHAIVSSSAVLHPKGLLEYLQLWNTQLDTEVSDRDLYFLMAFYFLVPGGGKKQQAFQEKIRAELRPVDLREIEVLFLPLNEVKEDDLDDFIGRYQLAIPAIEQHDIARQIVRKTGGEYEPSIDLLELVVYDQYQILLQRLQGSTRRSGLPGFAWILSKFPRFSALRP